MHLRHICQSRLGKKCRSCGRRSKILALFCCLICACAVLLIYMWQQNSKREIFNPYEPRILLWWTDTNEPLFYRNIYCGYYTCTITNDRLRLKEAKVILFDGISFDVLDMPLPRYAFQLWALLYDRSPANRTILFFSELLRYFNYTSTFSRYSDFPLTLHTLSNVADLVNPLFLRRSEDKSEISVLFMENNCNTMSSRENYVRELMSYVPVYSCGSCLRNRDATRFRHEIDVVRFMSIYRFTLVLEDVTCSDYISSRYWQALTAGSIPIYYGSPTIRDWQPHNRSALYISDFHSVKDLADLIEQLSENETAYNEYLRHKLNSKVPITNQRLLDALVWQRDLDISGIRLQFEKQLCMAINSDGKPKSKVANSTHFDCPLKQPQPATLKNSTENEIYWKHRFSLDRCAARILDQLWQRNVPYTEAKFEYQLAQLAGWGACQSYFRK
ncbi:alpha-(1,3)-fucosyltransferase B-like [Ceratitis capitata]|uniref:alpha-(1,3)-fucosyltransferase B-like n=1 Tax=Ceratitis capitata TaxID=7213 RepID=UPI0006188809|nr:alpha-(1,3)-fucosyltransferase B-like [Ceratitis capitata]XP_020717971.1 alpha-(1,3)-fucosyltransferase B-like [Ceratitis capitata]XP_020717972.1 alpha-(1,3)-fucosyltransferase B-like [Ceratitis capitata]